MDKQSCEDAPEAPMTPDPERVEAMLQSVRRDRAASAYSVAALQTAKTRALAAYAARVETTGATTGRLPQTLLQMNRHSLAVAVKAKAMSLRAEPKPKGLTYVGRVMRKGEPADGLKVMAYAPDGEKIGGLVPTRTSADGTFELHLKKAEASRLSILGEDDACLYRHAELERPEEGQIEDIAVDIDKPVPPHVPERDPCAEAEPLITVPDLKGRALQDAAKTLEDLRLSARERPATFSNIAKDHVALQSPDPGARVKAGTTVDLTPSRGPAPDETLDVVVPDLRGLAPNAARERAQAVGLGIEVTGKQPSRYPPGTVATQTPAAGQMVPKGSALEIRLSEAVEEEGVALPDLRGEDLGKAREHLSGLGLETKVGPPIASTVPTGHVAQQTPLGGQRVAEGAVVTLYPARKAEDDKPPMEMEMPELVGRASGDIDGTLQELRPASVELTFEPGRGRSVVLAQTPVAGQRIAFGRRLQLTLKLPGSWQKSRPLWLANIFQFHGPWLRSHMVDESLTEEVKDFVAELEWDDVQGLFKPGSTLSASIEGKFGPQLGALMADALRHGAALIDASAAR